jgi:hypothetical protein
MSTGSDFVTRKELAAHVAQLSDDIRAVGVSVERVESHVRGLAEALTSTREQLERKIDALEARLSARTSVIEEAVLEQRFAVTPK